MRQKKKYYTFWYICLSIFVILSISPNLFSTNANESLLINEISTSTTDDWIEMINIGTISAKLDGYRLRDGTASNKKDLSGDLPTGNYMVVDFSNWLNNSGDTVRLYKINENNEDLIDSFSYGSGSDLCLPSSAGSIGRETDGNPKLVRFVSASKGASNNSGKTDPCVLPTQVVSPTVKPAATAKPTITVNIIQPSNTPVVTSVKQAIAVKPIFTVSKAGIGNPSVTAQDNILSATDIKMISPTRTEVRQKVKPDPVLWILIGGGMVFTATGCILAFHKTTIEQKQEG